MYLRNGHPLEAFFYTVLHEFMHFQAGSPDGMMDWTWTATGTGQTLRATFPDEPSSTATTSLAERNPTLFTLLSVMNEGVTDLFTDLVARRIRQTTSLTVGLEPPQEAGLRNYDYARRAMYLVLERLEMKTTQPIEQVQLEGLHLLGRIYFQPDFALLLKSVQEKANRLTLQFLQQLSALSIYSPVYEQESTRLVLQALSLPLPEDLSDENDPGIDLAERFWT
jgi:hypothetical protein